MPCLVEIMLYISISFFVYNRLLIFTERSDWACLCVNAKKFTYIYSDDIIFQKYFLEVLIWWDMLKQIGNKRQIKKGAFLVIVNMQNMYTIYTILMEIQRWIFLWNRCQIPILEADFWSTFCLDGFTN